ncbi:hypothetical protein HO133_004460 [Letharia lupina]|uniref:Zinc metallopeptidase n=1 Tax=Letharia lupina TaxID=560253 RepID=A0A8H6FKB3_9LECA|nr:uncharacterized protein HO133_004460 [Letharia lupina]KAF6230121.1 hypothetical protein HO133_004460 [Letharia lupina]
MAFEHDPAVSEYQHERSRPREAEALQTLRKIASLVKPIMRQRGWKVGVLTEFYPPERNLLGLNINKGQKICLRLRYPGDERQFLPLEEVTDTMLHELCHIVFGPHDESFHNLWNQLRDEYDQLIRKGYTGEGFLSTGHKLGGRGLIPMHEARRLARVNAEKRRTLTAGSGQKLGGAPVRRGVDIRNVIADAAARRAAIMKGCASGVGAEREKEIDKETNKKGFRTKAEEDDANEEAIMIAYIDLVQEEERDKYGDAYIPPSKENPAGSQGGFNRIKSESGIRSNLAPQVPASTKPILPITNTVDLGYGQSTPPPHTQPPSTKPQTPFSDPWTCEICTLVNPANYLCCDACSTERSFPPPLPLSNPQTIGSTQARPSSIRDSNSKKAVKSLMSLEARTSQLPKKPIGWSCHSCGNFMESEWWTCARCGSMKQSS